MTFLRLTLFRERSRAGFRVQYKNFLRVEKTRVLETQVENFRAGFPPRCRGLVILPASYISRSVFGYLNEWSKNILNITVS